MKTGENINGNTIFPRISNEKKSTYETIDEKEVSNNNVFSKNNIKFFFSENIKGLNTSQIILVQKF